jgi:hypothetical protein
MEVGRLEVEVVEECDRMVVESSWVVGEGIPCIDMEVGFLVVRYQFVGFGCVDFLREVCFFLNTLIIYRWNLWVIGFCVVVENEGFIGLMRVFRWGYVVDLIEMSDIICY